MPAGKLQLETERLLLRPPIWDDFDAWVAFLADEHSMRHLGGVQSRPVAWRSVMAMAGAWQMQGFAMFCVIEKATGEWVGRVGPWMPEGWPGSEVGWGIVRSREGRGYATEAAIAAIDWTFDHLGWREVIHSIAPDNLASQGVAKKLGSRNRGPGQLPPPHEDSPVDIWAQTREEWKRR